MRRLVAVTLALLAGAAMLSLAGPALACSPPFDRSIAGQGPDAVVLVGTTGDRVAGGRQFHVERVYNGTVTRSPIVIAFKEGEPVGDCSYPMESGRHLVIVPERDHQAGVLHAGFATLQADPASPEGQAMIAEAEDLFGPGTVPEVVVVETTLDPVDIPVAPLAVVAAVIALGGVVLLLAVGLARRRDRPPEA